MTCTAFSQQLAEHVWVVEIKELPEHPPCPFETA